MDVRNFVVGIEFLSPYTANFQRLGGVGSHATTIGMQGKLLAPTGFGASKMLSMLIENYAILAIVPNSGRHAQC